MQRSVGLSKLISMQVLVDDFGNGSPSGVFVSGSTNFNTFFFLILCSSQANDGNWPTLKQNSASVKPTQMAGGDWKDSGMEGALKQGAISSQPLPLSALGDTEKLVGLWASVCLGEFPCPSDLQLKGVR